MAAERSLQGWNRAWVALAAAGALTGCTAAVVPEPDVSVYPPTSLELAPLAYSDSASEWANVSILNQTFYNLDVKDVELRDVSAEIAATLPEGTLAGGAAFLEVQGVPAGTVGLVLAPRQSVSLQVRVATSTQVPRELWTGGKYLALLHFQVGGSGVVDAETNTTDINSYRSITKEIQLSFELNCDLDGDGAEAEECGGADCDDRASLIGPDEDEACDGFDNNCSGLIDEGCPTSP